MWRWVNIQDTKDEINMSRLIILIKFLSCKYTNEIEMTYKIVTEKKQIN